MTMTMRVYICRGKVKVSAYGSDYFLSVSTRKRSGEGPLIYLQVNALGEWIIGIYLHEFTNNEREIKFQYRTRPPSAVLKNFEFIVSERVQVNPDNSRAMSALTFLLFKLNTLQAKLVKFWVSQSHGVMTVVYRIYRLHHGYYTTIMTSRRLLRHNPGWRGTNQPIRKSEFVQCMKVE